MKKIIFFLLIFLVPILQTNRLQAADNKAQGHQQSIDSKVAFSKQMVAKVLNYGSPAFNNPNYYYTAIKTAPSGVFYRQAGLSPNGQKIVAQKSYTDGGGISRTEVVLMNSDGTGETVISPGNSNPDSTIGYGNIYQNGNPFWSKDGTAVGYGVSYWDGPGKVARYVLSSSTTSYIYQPAAPHDVNNPDFLGSSTTSIVFWDVDGGGFADLYIWDGSTLTDITNTLADREYEPVSNAAGDKIVYWSGEIGDVTSDSTCHTLTYSGGSWHKDVGFSPIPHSYWPYWTNRTDNYIGVTLGPSKDVMIYDNTGTLVTDLTGPGYSGGVNQRNFFGTGFEGPHGEILLTSNAGQSTPTAARDIMMAIPFPTTQASNITFSSVAATSMNIAWVNGSGTGRAVFMKAVTTGTADPVNGIAYTTNLTPGGWNCVSDQTGSSTLVSGLTPGTSYRIMVCEYNGNHLLTSTLAYKTSTATDNPKNITTFTLPAAPVPVAPVNGLTGVSVVPTFRWHHVAGATSYKIYIHDDSLFSGGTWTYAGITDTLITFDPVTYSHFPLTNGTKYYWKVSAAVLGDEGLACSTLHFTTYPLVVAYLSNPTNGSSAYTPSTIFSWYTGQANTGLTFMLEIQASPTPPVDDSFWLGEMPVETTDLYKSLTLFAGRTFYWRVLIRKSSPSSPPYDYVYYPTPDVYNSFTILGGSTTNSYPSYPIGGGTVYTNTPTLYWYTDVYQTGIKYQIAYSADSSETHGVLNSATKLPDDAHINTATTNLFYTFTSSLTAGTNYYWQVRVYDPTTGYGNWSSISSFHTNGTGTLLVPIPSYPTGSVTVYTTTPTFYWYLPSYSSGLTYDVEVSTDNTSESNFNSHRVGGTTYNSGITDQQYISISGLTPGQAYYWRVRSKNSLGSTSSWSETIPIANETFTVAGGVASAYPVLTWPIDSTTVYTSTPTLYWYLEGSSLGLTGYVVKYKKAPAPADWTAVAPGSNTADIGTYTITPVTTTYKTVTTALTYGGHYYWAVATSAGASSNANYRQGEFTIVGGAGASDPILSQPSDGSTVYSTSVTFSWFISGSAIGIQGYELVYSQSDVFDPSVTVYYDAGSGSGVHHPRLTSQLVTVTGLVPGATYYWKVRSWYGGSTFSNWVNSSAPYWSFNVQVGSSVVVQPIVGGPNNVTINTVTPMLSWVLPTKTAANSTYEVQLAENSNFSNAKSFSSSKASCSASGLSSNKNYYWRVRSKAADGTYSYYSNTGNFSVGDKATAIDNNEVLPTEYSLSQNYPNPFNPSTRISFSLPQNSKVALKIFDMLGREIKTIINEEMNAGNHSTIWNGDNNLGNKVSSGVYIYRLTAGDYISTKKMVLMK